MSGLTFKRSVSVTATHELTVTVADLVAQFTDEQLRAEGLYRDLRDADIARETKLRDADMAREAKLRELVRAEQARCGNEDCDCRLHSLRRRKQPANDSLPDDDEQVFWTHVRQLLQRRDLNAAFMALEQRAWLSAALINLPRA